MIIACRRTLLAFIVLLLLSVTTTGQPACKIEYYSTEQGLSHQAVTCILKDREGFMWFGSRNGINRFDGHSFISYKSYPGDMSQLGNDRIDQIVEDQADHLWMEAYDRQIYRFDKKTGQFLPLSAIIGLNGRQKIAFNKILAAADGVVWLLSVDEGLFCIPQIQPASGKFTRYGTGLPDSYRLPSDSVNFWHRATDGAVWIGTTRGLSCLVLSDTGVYRNRKLPASAGTGKNFTAFDEDATNLYFSTTDGSLYVFNKSSHAVSSHKIAGSRLNAIRRSKLRAIVYATSAAGEIITFHLPGQHVSTSGSQGKGALHAIYEDCKGRLWIEPDQTGVVCFNPVTGSYRHFSHRNVEHPRTIGNRFRVLEDNNNLVWVNLKGGGFGYYDVDRDSINYTLSTPETNSHALPGIVYTIYYDEAGILWLTTNERQLVKIILQGRDFKQRLLVNPGSVRSDNEVRGIGYDRKGRLWMGAKSGRLYVYQHEKKLTGLFDNEPPAGLGPVYSMLEDSQGNIWLGTKGSGLYKATAINKEASRYHLTHFAHDEGDPASLPCNDIYSLLEDRQGRIWIGSFDAGLIQVDNRNNNIAFIRAGQLFSDYPKGALNKIRHMALDKAGNIWIGTTTGLLLFRANAGPAATQYFASCRKVPGDKLSLGNNDIQYIYCDSHGRMWLATSGGGFCLASGEQPLQSLQFKNYTTRDGLPNDYVLSCVEDKQGNLWLATENGLAKFNPTTRLFRNYDSYDGLPRLGFSEASCSRSQNGELVFGTTKGYISFQPDDISNNRIAANLAFTNLQINNKDVLQPNINYATDLTLKYNQNIISIDYAILDQRAGHRQAVVYRLLGFDSTWYDDRQQWRATYTNLPPGKYTFEVKSLSSDLYSNTPYKRLAITILPPPWKTGWAYLLYLIAIGLIGVFVRRNALAMIRLKNKIAIEQKLAALKLHFFTNVSHELRTPLTLIVSPLEQLARKEKLSPEGKASVEVAHKNARRMVRFINQLLDLRKVESNKATLHLSSVEVVGFVKRIAAHFSEALKQKQLKLEILPDQEELIAGLDAEKLDIVVYNLLANAIKFTPEGRSIKVRIETIAAQGSFSIAVADQGPGVDAARLKDIFELFYEGDHPSGRDLKGSGIGLALSRELVLLHGGSIRAANNTDGGLTVTVQLRLVANAAADPPGTPPENACYNIYEPQQSSPALAAAPLPGDPQAPLVLLVEDNDELRAFLGRQLSETYRVEMAKDGQEGWQKAVDLMPDLVVSDIMMPRMDGIQLLDRLKNDLNTSHIPVVLLSAKHAVESQIEGLQYGADYYITKPFNNEFLLASINNLLRQRKKLFESLVSRTQPLALSPTPIVVTSKDEMFLKDVIRIVEEKMTDPGFHIETVAEAMNMGRTVFYRKFKSLTGLTPVEFVRDMRLQRARQYLDTGNHNIAEAAYWSGFNNPKYFSTCFKEKYHVSPTDYLKKAKQV